MKVRLADRSELEWINQRYDEVQFVHSDYDHEIVAIAEYAGERAGLGRLIKVDENDLELSGIYVFEKFRGKGIAKEIVEFLLRRVEPSQIIHCIPFEHLVDFYQGFGFGKPDFACAPKKVLDKYHWCLEKYPTPTSLLVLHKNH